MESVRYTENMLQRVREVECISSNKSQLKAGLLIMAGVWST